MPDVTILGSGSMATACASVLTRAGFSLRRAFEVEAGDRSPVILGDMPAGFGVARQLVETGRHVLVTSPAALTPERLSLLLDNRKRAQAIFVWSERRYHSAYRFLASLIEADATWRPRFIRQETLTAEATTGALARWLAVESLTVVLSLADQPATSVFATSAINTTRNAPDLLSMAVTCSSLDAYLQVGLGEAMERRETLFAAPDRKAFIDELNQNTPIRIVEDERGAARAGSARWLSTPAPTVEELARQQCLAFFDATLKSHLAVAEADVWLRSLAALTAAEQSLSRGAAVAVEARDPEPRFRLVAGLHNRPTVA